MPISGKKILVMLTGGIACYKIPNLVRLLVKDGAEVRVAMTKSATRFITPLTLESVSRNPVATELFPDGEFVSTRHIELAAWPDLIVVAPVTANFIGKSVAGISDDLVSTIICASKKEILMVPAMNPGMWSNKITQRNFKYLTKEMKWHSIGPEEGEMAEDEWGKGRMSEPEEIFAKARSLLLKSGKLAKISKKKALSGKNIIVTAGSCREPIDPVRYISNRSSGRMGFAIAAAAYRMGANVTLVAGSTTVEPPEGPELILVERTAEMYKAVSARFRRCDCLIMAAAPSDFEVAKLSTQKIKKQSAVLQLSLKPTVDILESLGKRKKNGQILVGFALETENGIDNARDKLKRKNLDLILLNNPHDKDSAFEHDTNKLTLIRPRRKPESWPLMTKDEAANKLLLEITNLMM